MRTNLKRLFALIIILPILSLPLIACGKNKSKKESSDLSESEIIDRIKEIDVVIDVKAATEDNDPNNKLNKSGGYTSNVFFSVNLLDQSKYNKGDPVSNGTDCGGCVEVYKNKSDAKKRNEYLAKFDGSFLDPGSHTVFEKMVVRTSADLTASQQKEVEEKIIKALS